MSTPAPPAAPAAPAAPKAPKRIRRLNSISNKNKPLPFTRSKPAQPPPPAKSKCCDDPKIEDDGEGKVCQNCFTQVTEVDIVAEVEFQEDAQGAARVQGSYIGEHARHANTLGAGVARRIGGGEKNSIQEAEAQAKRAIGAIAPRLGIPAAISDQAVRLYILASKHNFSAGRRNDEVTGACLYAACRRQKDNTVLLIDIAERQRLNVFRLGEVYKDLCVGLFLDHGTGYGATSGVGTQYLLEVESLIMKYCKKLEFGQATRRVAEDATKIVRRMKRDWMVTGRHPAGLCGASIILAARMNNFRRSVREVVYVSKVADATIQKRVEEFRRTQSAALTVDQFRKYGNRLKHEHDPPAILYSKLAKEKFEDNKRKRVEASQARETAEIRDNSAASSRESSASTATPEEEGEADEERPSKKQRTASGQTATPATPASTQQVPRRDADGFAIPALPAGAAATDQQEPQQPVKRRGRPKKVVPEPIVLSAEELDFEKEVETDINDMLNDEEIIDSRNEIEKARDEERAKLLAEEQKLVSAERIAARRRESGIDWWDGYIPSANEEVTAEDLEAEFANDMEVQNCVLGPEEQKFREQVWVTMNEDWMRAQHEKHLAESLAKANDRCDKGKKKGKGTGRRRKGRMGDGTLLAEAAVPIEGAADANRLMLESRGAKKSGFIDYEALRRIYGKSSSRSASNTLTQSGTPPIGDAVDGAQIPAATGGAEAQSASPSSSPAPSTPAGSHQASAPGSPTRTSPTVGHALPTPGPTQQPDNDVSEVDDDDDDDAAGSELDYGSDNDDSSLSGMSRFSEEPDYHAALDPNSRIAYGGTYNDDEEFT